MKTHSCEDEWARGILRNPNAGLARKVAARRTLSRRTIDPVVEAPKPAARLPRDEYLSRPGRINYSLEDVREPEPVDLPKPSWWRRLFCGALYVQRDRQWHT